MSSPSKIDYERIVSAVLAGATNLDSHLHGEGHWKCVSWTGLHIVRASTPPHAIDVEVVALFGLLHDSRRLDDGTDAEHGRRAAAFVLELHERRVFHHLNEARVKLLADACAGHVDGHTSEDATIGACWDADRLNLCRLGIRPKAKYLSTKSAQRAEVIRSAEALEGARKSWTEIFTALAEPPEAR